ncbi:hypothetical protein CHS0354_026942 [Potamilus streckersoni]|uniref:non-specific serine/threonine protein kinase n=1 Tax=Potamilus streckersoni TaxID=2493646 RepID=A0AAE0VTB2_9BIVA|nr:hypothetical protein CHS0354_026942 [Potamilus streckersoni]
MAPKREKERKPRVLANRYEIVKKLGKGNFGTAYLCKDLRNKLKDGTELKVLKEISVGDLQPDESVDAMHEARLLSKLDHPSIVKFHDSFIDGEFFCIVTEYCEGGDLDMKINEMKKKKEAFDEKTIMDWFIQLILAVHYMHTRRVLHRDLKTRNIFLKMNRMKIGDFGISRILMGTTDLASTFTGTPYYMSPEVLKHEGYNSKSDIWSIGCILYELCTLNHAFNGTGLMAVMYKVVEGEPNNLPSTFSPELNNIFRLMLNKDPAKRPAASELLKIPFIAQHLSKMSADYLAKHPFHDLPGNAKTHAEEIAKVLREKSHLEDLRLTEEDVKLKNLPPRERMRLRKQQEADQKAKDMSEMAKVQLKANIERKQRIKSSINKTSVPVWKGGGGEGEDLKEALTVKQVEKKPKNFGNKTAPVVLFEEDENSDPVGTRAAFSPSRSLGSTGLSKIILTPDDRPIAPMKNLMVYDRERSTLDFKDGIPDIPEVAETYYSQFEDEFYEEADSEGTLKEQEFDDNLDIQFGSSGEITPMNYDITTTHQNDEELFYNQLQYLLDKKPDGDDTITLKDDEEAGAYGPVARETKIKNLRVECEKMLGKVAFEKAYIYLKRARSDRASEVTEEDIIQGLREFVKNPSDCFLVDQLLFLEEQHHLL